MIFGRRAICLALTFWVIFMTTDATGADWLSRVPTDGPDKVLRVQEDRTFYFLRFGQHSFEPDQLTTDDGRAVAVEKSSPVLLAPFQRLYAIAWTVKDVEPGTMLRATRAIRRDAFWDQVLRIDASAVSEAPRETLVEAGYFGSVLPESLQNSSLPADKQQSDKDALVDPVIPPNLDREMSWSELESKAYPLDFQKILLASFNDSNPAFAFENGQWLTTWLSRDLPKWNKEDHWFAPALLIDGQLIRPAPLSARGRFVKTADGMTLPCWLTEWKHGPTTVTQQLFSFRSPADAEPQGFVRFRMTGAPAGAKLAIGVGRRPNVHWWDEKSRERTPIPFFTLDAKYRQQANALIDASDHVILTSAQSFKLNKLGPAELMIVFDSDAVDLVTPQSERKLANPTPSFDQALEEFTVAWRERLRSGATVNLPSIEWMQRIDIWRAQMECITRVRYQDKMRLSYGAYFYQYYFGIEEGWPVVAFAQWGRADEAKRQAEIMLEAENLDKSNVHHQSRNGIGPACAATVARLTNDRAWLESVAAPMLDCANWTISSCKKDSDSRSPVVRGLLPAHIYGGDVRDPATSVYATAACWRGLVSTADAFQRLGSPELKEQGKRLSQEAESLHQRIDEVINNTILRDGSATFVPFALELPSLNGKNEGPYDRLTASRLGNYWNLFAPSLLELRYSMQADHAQPNDWVFNFTQTRGGLWAGLPRFYDGLDAAYALGNISHLIERSTRDPQARHVALASLQSFFLHAASRNGYTIPEVAGLFPYRLDRRAYEQLVRESPWNFGMYDAHRYLEGHISFTEPLGAGAGEALTMIRDALVTETRDANGLPDGGLMLLSAVPSDWFAEGQVIELRDFPTAYGIISLTVRSTIQTQNAVTVEHRFVPHSPTEVPRKLIIRVAPPGRKQKDIELSPVGGAATRIRF